MDKKEQSNLKISDETFFSKESQKIVKNIKFTNF